MDTTTTQVNQYSQEELLDLLFLGTLEAGFQIAIWKNPQEQKVHAIIDKTEKIKRVPLELENLTPGFIIHPFSDQEDKKAYYMEASEHITFSLQDNRTILDQPFSWINFQLDPAQIKRKIKEFITNYRLSNTDNQAVISTSRQDFIDQVNKGISAIASGQLSKIVPVRRKKVLIKKEFDIAKTFLKLCNAYPNALVNFYHIPSLGSWIGASPEVLIKTKGDCFSTMSLAGSQRAIGDNPLKNVAWTQKEIEEQALVSRYIVNCFKKIRLREYEEIGPKTDIAGNLLHLRTDFKVNMKATNFPQLGSIMLELLHPTSAVAGMPRDRALEFIRKHEKFDRALFSGFIGPVNIDDQTLIFVNLRCAKLLSDHALLFAGAGVTEDSDPEKEWEETELKCDIIGKFIQENE